MRTDRTRIPAWLPDAITLSRVALLPVFLLAANATRAAALAGRSTTAPRVLTILVIIVIAASDWLDGYLARRAGRPLTRRGAILDATADRLAQWTGGWFFTLSATPGFTALPLWFPLLIVARDLLLLVAWLIHPRPRDVTMEHELHGKAATVAVFAVVMGAVSGAPSRAVAVAAGVAGCAVAYSTFGYLMRMRRGR